MDTLSKLAEAFAKSRGLESNNNSGNNTFVTRHYARTAEGLQPFPEFIASVLAKKYPNNFSTSIASFAGAAPFVKEYRGEEVTGLHLAFKLNNGDTRVYSIYAENGISLDELSTVEARRGLLIGTKVEKGVAGEGNPLSIKIYQSVGNINEFEAGL